jgi:hypothetical protein
MIRMMNCEPATEWPPPKTIPPDLLDEFTQQGELTTGSWYFAQRYSGTTAQSPVWTQRMVESLMEKHVRGQSVCGYALNEQLWLRKAALSYSVSGKTIAVIGSESPWVEAILFSCGARNVTTIEYGDITSTVKNHRAFTPRQFAQSFLKERIEFDMVVSFSSLEHSGLGRYGDALNPRGDIDAAEEVYCMLKPCGYFLIALPYVRRSHLVWNAHRQYGPERMKLFGAGYRQVDYIGNLWSGQGTFVLQKPGEGSRCLLPWNGQSPP